MKKGLALLLAAILLLLAGCGAAETAVSRENGPEPAAETTPAPTPAPTPEPTPEPYEPVLDALALLPSLNAEQTIAMSSWMQGASGVVRDGVYYGRCFERGNPSALFVSLELRSVGDTLSPGAWTKLRKKSYPHYLSLREDTMFFTLRQTGGSDALGVYRMNTDGSEHTKLYDGACLYLSLVGDRLYFTDADAWLVSTDLNGEDLTVVLEKEVFFPYFLSEDWLLYQDDEDNESLHLLYRPEEIDIKLNDERSYDPIITGDWLFYCTPDENDEYHLARIDLSCWDEEYDETLGCHVPVFTPEHSEKGFSSNYLIDGTAIYVCNSLEPVPLDDWTEAEAKISNGRYYTVYRAISPGYIVYDDMGGNDRVDSINFLAVATGATCSVKSLR